MLYLLRLSCYGIFRNNLYSHLDSGQLRLRFFLRSNLAYGINNSDFFANGGLWQTYKFVGLFNLLLAF